MSSARGLPFAEAYRLAEQVAEQLRPHAIRLKAAGSLRRRRPTCGDIEFVIEPPMVAVDLFGTCAPLVAPIRAALEELGVWIKGGDRMMQIEHVLGVEGLKCECYLSHPPAQFGSILAIRTGPYELGRHAMMELRRRGYAHEGGHVVELSTGNIIPTPEEEDFFRLAGLPHWAPVHRDNLYTRLEAGEKLEVDAA